MIGIPVSFESSFCEPSSDFSRCTPPTPTQAFFSFPLLPHVVAGLARIFFFAPPPIPEGRGGLAQPQSLPEASVEHPQSLPECRRDLLESCLIKWGFPKIRGTILGVPIIRTILYWGLYWVPPILGNYQMLQKK